MKSILFTLLFSMAFITGYTQLYNAGGMITVQSGATLVIEGDYTSSSSGDITIDGTVQLKGDFINNSGTVSAGGTPGTLKFNGTAAQEIKGSSSTTFNCNVEIDNATGVSLTSANQVLAAALALTNGKLTLNAYDLTLAAASTITGAGAAKYVATNSTGQLKRPVGASNVDFPVGTATTYNPLVLNNAGTSDTYGVIATATMPTNWTTGNHAVGRTWVVTEVVGSGSNLTVTPQWGAGDEQASFDRTDCAVGLTTDDGTSFTWTASGAAAGANPYTRTGSGITQVGKFVVGDYYHEGIDLDIDVFLAGPYSGGTMSTALNTAGLIPLADPYGHMPNVASIPANVVDWVEVELRNPSNTVVKSYSFFLRNDGKMLNTDGNLTTKLTGLTKGSYYIAVNHRNHLGAMISSPVDFTSGSSFAVNFKTGSGIYGIDAMQNIGGTYALWAGDVNGDGQIIYQGNNNDPTPIGTEVLGDPSNSNYSFTYVVNGYSNNDINMDGQVIYQGDSNDPTSISTAVLGHPGNTNYSFTHIILQQFP